MTKLTQKSLDNIVNKAEKFLKLIGLSTEVCKYASMNEIHFSVFDSHKKVISTLESLGAKIEHHSAFPYAYAFLPFGGIINIEWKEYTSKSERVRVILIDDVDALEVAEIANALCKYGFDILASDIAAYHGVFGILNTRTHRKAGKVIRAFLGPKSFKHVREQKCAYAILLYRLGLTKSKEFNGVDLTFTEESLNSN